MYFPGDFYISKKMLILRPDCSFCAWNCTVAARIDFYSIADCPGCSLKKPFHFVMVAAAPQCIQVKIALGAVYKCLPEIFKTVSLEAGFYAVGVKAYQRNACKFSIAHKERTTAKINCGSEQSFIHWIKEIACTVNAGTIAKSLCKTKSKNNACIFNQMMLINIQIPLNFSRKIKKSVLAERTEHVVKKSDWIFNFTLTSSIKIQCKRNLSFASFSFNSSCSHFF